MDILIRVRIFFVNIPFFFFPEIHTDENQGFFVVFNTGNPLNPMLNDAFAQHVDSSGGIWSAEGVQIATSANGNKYNGGYCWNPSDSTLCVALRIQDGNQTMSGISLQKINTAGERLLGDDGLELHALNTEMYTPWLLLNSGDGLVCIYGIGGFNNQKIKGLKTDYNGLALWSYDPIASASNSNKDDLSAGPFKNGQIWPHCSWAPFVGSFSTHSIQCNLKPMSLTNFSLAMMKSITLIGCCRSSDYFLTNYAALFQHSIAMLCWNVLMTSTYVKTFKVVMNGIRTEPWMSVVGSNLWPIL